MIDRDEILRIIKLFDDFANDLDLEAIEKLKEQKFPLLKEYVLDKGNLTDDFFVDFDATKSSMKSKIKSAEAHLKSAGSSKEKYEKQKQDAQKVKKMIKKLKKELKGLEKTAREERIKECIEKDSYNILKKGVEESIHEKDQKIICSDSLLSVYNGFLKNIDDKNKVEKYIEAKEIEDSAKEYNKLRKEYADERAKSPDKQDEEKIENLKRQLEVKKEYFKDLDFPSELDTDVVREIKESVQNGNKVSVKELEAYTATRKTEIETTGFSQMIKTAEIEKQLKDYLDANNCEMSEDDKKNYAKDAAEKISKDFLEVYNLNRPTAPSPATDIKNIKDSDITADDIIAFRKKIANKKTKEFIKNATLREEKKTAKETFNYYKENYKRIEKIKEKNLNYKQVYDKYASAEEKNEIQQYKNSFVSRFRFWRQSNGLIGAFFRAFNKKKTVKQAKERVGEELSGKIEESVNTTKGEMKKYVLKNGFDNKFVEAVLGAIRNKKQEQEQQGPEQEGQEQER